MKKKMSRMLCLLLSMLMLTALLPVSAFADDVETVVEADENAPVELLCEEPQFQKIVNVGDSVAAACGISAYTEQVIAKGSFIVDSEIPYPGSYAQLLRDALNASCYNAGHSAWRSSDFLYAMDQGQTLGVLPPEDSLDYAFYTSFFSTLNPETLCGNAVTLKNELRESDLILVNFGANDIFSYSMMSVMMSVLPEIMSELGGLNISELGNIRTLEDLVATFALAVTLVRDGADLIVRLIDTINRAVPTFAENYPAAIRRIREINPDAKIVCLSIDNPIRLGFNMPDGSIMELYTIANAYQWAANDIILRAANSVDNCQYVDVTGSASRSVLSVDYLNADLSPLMEEGFEFRDMNKVMAQIEEMRDSLATLHPNDAGHVYIANRILEALKRDNGRPELTASRNSLGQSVIRWAPIPGAYGYRVYRSTAEDGGYRLLAQTALPGIADLSALPNKVYYYRAVALMNLTGTIRSGASDAVHVHVKGESVAAIPASCEHDGNMQYWLCKACDAKLNRIDNVVTDVTIPRFPGHVYDKTVLKSAASCTKAAEYVKVCACDKESEPFTVGKPLGHCFGAWKCREEDPSVHEHFCARCGAVESSRHNFADGICLSCGTVSNAVVDAKTAAKAALNDKAGAKQSAAMKLIVREGERAIDEAKTLSAVTLAKNTALASVETRLLLEKPVTTIINALTKLFK